MNRTERIGATKEPTKYDLERIAKAEAKRARKNAKRLQDAAAQAKP